MIKKVFSCKVYILNNKNHLSKLLPKVDEGILVGYSSLSIAYRAINKRSLIVEESYNVVLDETTNT